jgi:hypothetical protein
MSCSYQPTRGRECRPLGEREALDDAFNLDLEGAERRDGTIGA